MSPSDLSPDERSTCSAALVATLAHQLERLLTAVGVGVDALRSVIPATANANDTLIELDRAVDVGFDLGRQLREIAHPGRAGESLVDLNEVISQGRHLLDWVLGSRVRFVFELTSMPSVIRADPVRLEWLVLNLASNAADSMPDDSTVTIGTAVVEGPPARTPDGDASPRMHVRLTVSDTGDGMTHDVQDAAFEPFFTTRPGRSGLGLTTAAITVGRLGGWLQLHSNVPHGTRAEVYLPLL